MTLPNQLEELVLEGYTTQWSVGISEGNLLFPRTFVFLFYHSYPKLFHITSLHKKHFKFQKHVFCQTFDQVALEPT